MLLPRRSAATPTPESAIAAATTADLTLSAFLVMSIGPLC